MANTSLSKAKDAKNDEFYTPLTEIQKEISNYTDKFEGKVVFCNCDDPFESNFVKYFLMNFNRLKLKELIATGYLTSPVGGTEIGTKNQPYALRVKSTSKYLVGTQKDLDVRGAKYFLETEGSKIMTTLIGNFAHDVDGKQIEIEESVDVVDDDGNPILTKAGKPKTKKVKKSLYYEAGDFRSDMSVELLKQSDIVCTNPPFSLWIEYINQIISFKKDCLIIGNKNAITFKDVFPLLKDNLLWLGNNIPNNFIEPDGTITKRVNGLARWYTTLDHAKRHIMIPLDLGFTYYGHEDMYPKYDNYDAINVDKVAQIPCDYEPCWYKCPHAENCRYAQTEGKEDKALCEQSCNGEMGVPISYLDKHCPEQMELIKFRKGDDNKDLIYSVPCSQSLNVEREREREKDDNRTSELSFAGCRKCNGIIGVPISFLDKYCPEQFRIIEGSNRYGITNWWEHNDAIQLAHSHGNNINGQATYFRIHIQKVQRSDGGSDKFFG